MPQLDLAGSYMSLTHNATIIRSLDSDRNKNNKRQADTQITLKKCVPVAYMTVTDQIKIALLLFHEDRTVLDMISLCNF